MRIDFNRDGKRYIWIDGRIYKVADIDIKPKPKRPKRPVKRKRWTGHIMTWSDKIKGDGK